VAPSLWLVGLMALNVSPFYLPSHLLFRRLFAMAPAR
jgi:hypothetical protein